MWIPRVVVFNRNELGLATIEENDDTNQIGCPVKQHELRAIA